MIEIKGLNFHYGPHHILKDISLKTSVAGKIIAIIGPNGSGKSTLMNILSRFLNPSSGSYSLEGKIAADFSYGDFSRLVSYIPQETVYRFPYKVWEIVQMARFPYRNRPGAGGDECTLIEDILVATDTGELAWRSILELSGGERQRVNMARALAQDTPFLFMDEPLSAMDIYYQLHFLKLLKTAAEEKGQGVITILHDLTMVDHFADEVWVLHEGHLAASGPCVTILQPEFLQDIFGVPFLRTENMLGLKLT